MKMEKLVGGGGTTGCYGGDCPTIYSTDRGTFVVQGSLIPGNDLANFSLPAHEGVVEIPESLVRSLVSKLDSKL
jgi:hypothetical protein